MLNSDFIVLADVSLFLGSESQDSMIYRLWKYIWKYFKKYYPHYIT